MSENAPIVVVTGANGLVGSRVCAALAERGATVRALVRTAGTAPRHDRVEEHVGDFTEEATAAAVLAGADAAVTTVHPMGSDGDTQHRVGVEGTTTFARAASAAGAGRLVHVSTAAVYDRSPGRGDVDEDSALVADDAGDYPVTKRDTDAALAEVPGITTFLVRPPAIVGRGESSIWNTLRPASTREDPAARRAVPEQSWAWVHVDDLASLLADLATGALPAGGEAGTTVEGCTAVNAAAEPASWKDYLGTVCAALGVEPDWQDGPAWTGHVLADRARHWGWTPRVGLGDALAEIDEGLRSS